MTKPPFIVSRPWTPEEEDQLRTLAISGESIAAISKRLWRSEGALRHRARALGIVLKKGMSQRQCATLKEFFYHGVPLHCAL